MTIFTKISNLVEEQFPDFYRNEGPTFVEFLKSYYQWLETSRQPVNDIRSLLDYNNIDSTLDEFIDHFTKLYLNGIPPSIRGDKRTLVKHVLDVYRAKGSIQGYKLLFRLLFNESIDVYLPSVDILRASDGTWYQPKFLEVTNDPYNVTLGGKRIKGSSTGSEAIVESVIQETVNGQIITMLFLSDISGDFKPGEKITEIDLYNTAFVAEAPSVKGSVSSLKITSGGQNFSIGDVLVAVDGNGRDALFQVSATSNGTGTLAFDIVDGGSLFSLNADEILSRQGPIQGVVINAGGTNYAPSDTIIVTGDGTGAVITPTLTANVITGYTIVSSGSGYIPQTTTLTVSTSTGSGANLTANVNIVGRGASFDIGGITNIKQITYARDFLFEYADVSLGATSYGFPANASGNATSHTLSQLLTYTEGFFGTIASLTNINTGNNYISPPDIMVRDFIFTSNQYGRAFFSNNSYNVTGIRTEFQRYLGPNTFVRLWSNSTSSDIRRVLSVTNNTFMTLDDFPYNHAPGGISNVTISAGGTGYSNGASITFTTPTTTHTNFLLRSEQFSNASIWPASNATITANVGIADPVNAGNTVSKLVESTSANVHYITQQPANNSGNLTFSIFAKAAERSVITLRMDDGTANVITGEFNLSLGTALLENSTTPWSNAYTRIFTSNNGFYHCILSGYRTGSANTLYCTVALVNDPASTHDANGMVSYTGTAGYGAYIYGAQAESSNIATPYALTTTAANTVSDTYGSGAVATIVTGGGGTITGVLISNTGSGYYTAPTASVAGGAGATLTPVVDQGKFNVGFVTLLANFNNQYFGFYPTGGSELYLPFDPANGGQNEHITGTPQFGNGIITEVRTKNSGYGYQPDELIRIVSTRALSEITIVSGGVGYANNETLSIVGGSARSPARASVITNSNGTITSINMIYPGSGYIAEPTVSVITANGSGAELSAVVGAYNYTYNIAGKVIKGGLGIQEGYWTSTQGFLSADKYLQDSYYYQEYSYEIQAPISLANYGDILKRVYHPSGTELFGKFVYRDVVSEPLSETSFTITSA